MDQDSIARILDLALDATDRVDAGRIMMDGGKFERGDLLDKLAGHMGDDATAIESAREFILADPTRDHAPAEMTLKGELRVSRAIPYHERDVEWLPWSCYRELAALDSGDRAKVYTIARDEDVTTVAGIRLVIARVKGAPETDPLTDVANMPLAQAIRVELRRYYAGRYSDDDIDEFCEQYERIRGEVERAKNGRAWAESRAA